MSPLPFSNSHVNLRRLASIVLKAWPYLAFTVRFLARAINNFLIVVGFFAVAFSASGDPEYFSGLSVVLARSIAYSHQFFTLPVSVQGLSLTLYLLTLFLTLASAQPLEDFELD